MFDIASKLFDRLVTLDNGCQVFTGSCNNKGYGNIWCEGVCRKAHVLTYEYYNGPVPEGYWVLHTCDNPPCCLKEHLYAGTPQQNAIDRETRGRGTPTKGAENGNAKLSETNVIHIYKLLKERYTHAYIAQKFFVSKSAISMIKRGECWPELYRTYWLEAT